MSTDAIDVEKLELFINSNRFSSGDRLALSYFQQKKIKSMSYDLDLFFDDPDLGSKLQKAGVFLKTSGGVKVKEYPFKEQYKCLTAKSGFRELNQGDVNEARQYLENVAHNTAKRTERFTESNTEKTRAKDQKIVDRYIRALQQYPQCFRSKIDFSQMGEVIGDMIGALSFERFLADRPPAGELERVASVLNVGGSCSPDDEPRSRSPVLISQAIGRFGDSHPPAAERTAKLLLNLPYTAQIYGCRRIEPNCFDGLSLVTNSSRPGANAPAAAGAPPRRTGE